MILAKIRMDVRVLRGAVARTPGTTVEIDRIRWGPEGRVRGFFWASGGELEAFERELAADETVTNALSLTDGEHRRLYRADEAESGIVSELYENYVRVDGVLLSATTTGDQWVAELRFPDRASIQQFWNWWSDVDASFDLVSISDFTDEQSRCTIGLSPAQREALRLAHESGYFDIPRRTTMTKLATQLDISDQAFSERLRRGCATLISNSSVE